MLTIRFIPFMLIFFALALNAEGQNYHEVLQGMVRNYRVKEHPDAKQYQWEVFSDYENIKSAESDQVGIKSSPSGLQNEITIEWKAEGIFYLAVTIVGQTGCLNRKVWPFQVNKNWLPIAVNDTATTGIDIALWINVHANDSSTMVPSSIYIYEHPQHGSVSINSFNFGVDYVPDYDFMGVDSFYYMVCDQNNVCDTAKVVINVEDIINPPEVFTPNGDGFNDYFVINGLERYPVNHLTIYNRWGNMVYEKQNYNNDWDGYANVKNRIGESKLPVGVYYYILRYTNSRVKQKGVYLER